MTGSWSQHLSELYQQGKVTGFVLITPQGPSQAVGCFQELFTEGVSATIQALIKPFYSACDPPTTHTFQGVKLHVIQQTDSCYVAISKQRKLGLIALNLPLGVLLATFDRTIFPSAALTALEAALRTGPTQRQFCSQPH